jgi:hypothetical protein
MTLLAPTARAQEARPSGAPPTVISGRILTSTVDVQKGPGAPAIAFRYSAPAGLFEIYAVF